MAGLGVRFDTEEIVALQINGSLTPSGSPLTTELTLRLGKRIMGRADFIYDPIKAGRMRLSYIFRHDAYDVPWNRRRLMEVHPFMDAYLASHPEAPETGHTSTGDCLRQIEAVKHALASSVTSSRGKDSSVTNTLCEQNEDTNL